MTSGVVNRGQELLKRPVVMTSGVVNTGILGPGGAGGGGGFYSQKGPSW